MVPPVPVACTTNRLPADVYAGTLRGCQQIHGSRCAPLIAILWANASPWHSIGRQRYVRTTHPAHGNLVDASGYKAAVVDASHRTCSEHPNSTRNASHRLHPSDLCRGSPSFRELLRTPAGAAHQHSHRPCAWRRFCRRPGVCCNPVSPHRAGHFASAGHG